MQQANTEYEQALQRASTRSAALHAVLTQLAENLREQMANVLRLLLDNAQPPGLLDPPQPNPPG